MVIDPSVVGGEAALIPCVDAVETGDDAIEEAESLWRAESWAISRSGVSASWVAWVPCSPACNQDIVGGRMECLLPAGETDVTR
jgi:hypothetical protein